MKLFEAHQYARFIDRPNRFLIVAELPDGSHVRAHAPNPGRMWELLYPGTELILQRPSGKTGIHRKTDWSVVAAIRPSDGVVVPLVATAANELAKELVIPRLFPEATAVRREVTRGGSRFDFLVTLPDETILIEVKSCTLEAYGVAMFPDAATQRGRRHLEELTHIRDCRRMVLFVIQGPEASRFVPDIHTDPAFALTLRRAMIAGVEVVVSATRTGRDGQTELVTTEVPVDWSALNGLDENSGVYLLHMRIDSQKAVEVGALGKYSLLPGHYLYVGSAMGSMKTRTARHLRVRKRYRWHVDYLRARADWASVYPIYTTRRLECDLAGALAGIMEEPIRAFGSSDCSCGSHLFYSLEDPRRRPDFVELMLRFRHFEALK